MFNEADDEIEDGVCETCLEDLDLCECAREALRGLFEKFEKNEYLKSDKIPDQDRPTKRNDLNAFIKLDKLVPGNYDIIMCAEHDKIWLSVELEDLAKVTTADDVLYLVRCGVQLDDNGLCMYV